MMRLPFRRIPSRLDDIRMVTDIDQPPRARKASVVDSRYAWWRLVASVLISSVGGVGLWSTVVLLTEAESHFGIGRSQASLPYTAAMVGIMVGNVAMGRLADRFGIIVPVVIGALSLGIGYAGAAFATELWQFLFFQGVLIGGLGTASTFGPLIAATSLWFAKRRGIAVALVASGSYIAGTFWPPVVQHLVVALGWRDTHLIIGAVCVVMILPLTLALRRPPPMDEPVGIIASGSAPSKVVTAALSPALQSAVPLPVPPNVLQTLLVLAGIACCVAMSMPQVHIVAYCVDLDLGAARGAEMLSIMLGLGVVSRISFGMLMDRIGATWTLLLGSSLQALSLLLYLPADGLYSLYLVSAMFGLFQGGIVPAYAVIIRENFPTSEVGTRVGLVLSATIGGMALGGWMSGAIYDATLSYTAAFLNGFGWNIFNIAIVVLLIWRGRMPRISLPSPGASRRVMMTEAPLVGRWPGALL
jgi:MFS family permease